jgi:FkbM family methyltransferase
MQFYSQAGQDVFAHTFLRDEKKEQKGFYLDVGAYDGLHISNSRAFDVHCGWNGLCIEADPSNFQKLQNARQSSNNQNIHAAVYYKAGTAEFKSTQDLGSALVIEEKDKQTEKKIQVACQTFEQLFVDYKVPPIIDYMSLDIEGGEYYSLLAFPFLTHKIKILTIEHNL